MTYPRTFSHIGLSVTNLEQAVDFYTNVLDNLKWGSVTFYYEGYDVSYESLPAQMFPLTFQELIHAFVGH